MNWENYGKYKVGEEKRWQIDHIIPRDSFSFTSSHEAEFIECWSLKNLRPLDGLENNLKSNKL